MPQPEATSLLTRVLLLWIMALTLGQLAFTVIYFTVGKEKGNDRTEHQASSIKASSKMLDFGVKPNANNKIDKIEWKEIMEDTSLISIAKETITIKQDGYYFLSLKVTLQRRENDTKEYKVSLRKLTRIVLEEVIPKTSLSTGLLCKVLGLAATETLMVTISPPASINTTSEVTHMGLVYMPFSPK